MSVGGISKVKIIYRNFYDCWRIDLLFIHMTFTKATNSNLTLYWYFWAIVCNQT